jgi:hypothetical protein
MPAEQITPPGLLYAHSLLVAVAPAAIAGAGALSAWIVEHGASTRWKEKIRYLVALNLMAALIILALFLKPDGPVAAYTDPLWTGIIRIGYVQTGLALLLALWATWRWQPWNNQHTSSWAWSARVGLAMLLPMVAIPLLVLAIIYGERDMNNEKIIQRRWLPSLIIVLGSSLSALLLVSDSPLIYAWICAGITLASGGVLVCGRWKIPLILSGIALTLP